MRKYAFIAWLTMAIIACLQGYYISLQYDEFVVRTLTKMDDKLKISVDRDLNIRSKRVKKVSSNDEQKFSYRICSGEEAKKLKKENKDTLELRMDTINVDKLRAIGVVQTSQDVLLLMTHDVNEKEGYPLVLDSLYNIYKVETGNDFGCALLLLDSNKRTIKTVGEVGSGWYATKDICISLKNPRFIRAMVDIHISDFIFKSILSLLLSVLFSVIAIASVAYQLRVIRQKEELLRKRELSINGTIHDLKSPLNSAITLMKYLQTKIADKTMSELMGKATDRISQLVVNIEDLLITARGGKNRKIALKLEQADIAQLAEKARQDIDTIYNDKPHKIEISGTATAEVDKMYMENVIRNLMENAVKYADNGVEVKVSIGSDGGKTIISVEDNGWGIPKKSIPHVFKQFYRVPHDNAPKGYGIGLALVKYVVENHGGNISVESEEGKGSIFRIKL